MKKIVKAVRPYEYKEGINFKIPAYEAWVKTGGAVAKAHYPWRPLHRLFFNYDLPTLFHHKKEARLRFVQPVSLYFDAFPDYVKYEIIPFIWDCWPTYMKDVCKWFEKHKIKTAIFTSSQVANEMKQVFPEMNIRFIPEGIDVDNYPKGKTLRNRKIDFLEYGRNIDKVVKYCFDDLNVVRGQKDGKNLLMPDRFTVTLQDSKIVAAYPKNWTNPEQAGNIETLTQRFWEGMLSRCVMIGHAPKELIELLGYNPVIEVDLANPNDQLTKILMNIENYQGFVDKNREAALRWGIWEYRMKTVKKWLCSVGYRC